MSFGVVPNAMNGRPYNLDGRFNRTVRMIRALILFFSLFSYEMKADDFFIKKNFVILGQNPMPSTNPVSILSCGNKVKVSSQKSKISKKWSFVSVGPFEGYIKKQFLVKKKPQCFEDRFPKFYNSFKIKLSEIYYWARLNHHLLENDPS